MTAKEYLQQVYHIDQKIKRLKRKCDDLRLSLYAIESPAGNMDANKVQTFKNGDAILQQISRIDLLERDILREMGNMIEKKQIITEQIEALEDERYKTLLLSRYVLCWKWETIAHDMDYNSKWIFTLHSRALQAFSEKYHLDGVKQTNGI